MLLGINKWSFTNIMIFIDWKLAFAACTGYPAVYRFLPRCTGKRRAWTEFILKITNDRQNKLINYSTFEKSETRLYPVHAALVQIWKNIRNGKFKAM